MSSARSWWNVVTWCGVTALVVGACGQKQDDKTTEPPGGSTSGSGGMPDETDGAAAASSGGEDLGGGAGQDAGAAGAAAGGSGGSGGSAGSGGVAGDDGRGGSPLLLQVTTAQSPAIPGEPTLWTITVGNQSSVAAKDVSVLFRVPKGLTFSASLANPASSACGNGTCTQNEEASWKLGDLPAGATETIQVNPVVLDDVGEGDTIAALVRLSATDLDPVAVTKTVPVQASAPAELTLTASADPLVAGQIVELALDVGQIGEATLFDGQLRLELPGWLEVLDVSDAGTGPEEPSVANDVVWTLESVPVGGTVRRLIKAKVGSDAPAGEVLNPRASFSYEDAALDNVAQVPISVVAKRPPLVLEVKPVADPVVPGETALYQATISNTSLRAVDGIDLWLRVPPEVSYHHGVSAQPDSSTCGNGTCTAQELSRWQIGTLAAGTSETVTINPNVLAATAGDGTLLSTAFAVRAIGVNPLNVFKTIGVQTKPAAQLALGTSVGPATPGQTLTYELNVGQIGLKSLVDAVLTLELSPELETVAVSDQGAESNGVVSWDLGALAVGGTLQRSVSVAVAEETTPGSLLGARAILTYEGGQGLDAVSEHALTIVAEPLPLSVTLDATVDSILLGDAVSYTTTIKNNAARTIDGVELLLRVPAGTSYHHGSGADPDSSTCGNGTCTSGEESVWALGSIAAGATKIVNVSPTVAATLVAGSLVTFRQRLTAVELGGTIQVQSTLPTKK
jgi:uncharacterized repeat protein (TIGR01451 family)